MDYNGAQNADNISDIGKLIEILNEWEFKYEEEKRESKQGTIPQNPKYADIIKTNKRFSSISLSGRRKNVTVLIAKIL